MRRIFTAYFELGSITALICWAKANGIMTKLRWRADGSLRCGGSPFSKGNLHVLLGHHAYIGEMTHAGNIYPGLHEALLPRSLWDQVQAKLAAQWHSQGRGHCKKIQGQHKSKDGDRKECTRKLKSALGSRPLVGIVIDETGDLLTPCSCEQAKPPLSLSYLKAAG